MSKRYIDAEDLKAVIKANDWSNPAVPDVVGIIIDRSPTADVVEVRHGYWIHESFISKTGEKMHHTPYCSVCQNSQCFKTKYCPECGAKMDGERRSE